MGAKFWTAEEKQVFVDIIIPMSTEADKSNSTGQKLSWDELVPIMQAEMDKRGGTRIYSKNSLFQHWYQKVGPRAKRRGEADTMTVPSNAVKRKALQRHHNRGRNEPHSHFAGPSNRQFRGNGLDDDYYNSEDDSSDMESFSQYVTRRGASQAISKAGRRSMFVEETDEETEEDQARQARAHYRDPRYEESVWRHNRDLLDDENDVPGRAEDEAYEAAQRRNKNGNSKRTGKKQEKAPSGKRPRHSLNDNMDNDYEEPRRVPRQQSLSTDNTRPKRLNDVNNGVAKNTSNKLVDNGLRKFLPNDGQPNKAIPADNANNPHSHIIVDENDDYQPYESPYQPRASASTFAQNRGSQVMGSRYIDNTQRRPQNMRSEQIDARRHSNRDLGSFGHPETMSGYGSSSRVSPSGYLSEQAEQRQAYLQQTTHYMYHGQQAPREHLRKHDLTDEGAGRFPTSNERYQYAPPIASSTSMDPAHQSQRRHLNFNPRPSNGAQAQASPRGHFLTPHPQEQGRSRAPPFHVSGLPTPGLVLNSQRERTSSPAPEPALVAADIQSKGDELLEVLNGDEKK